MREVEATGEVYDLTAFGYYVTARSGDERRREVFMAIPEELSRTGEKVVVTIADALRAEGRAEERIEAAVRAVLAVFVAREMIVPDDVRVRIEACDDPDLLEVWHKRAIKADSPEGIFAE